MSDATIPAAVRSHLVNGARVTTAIPLCRCDTPIPSLWHGDCSHCRGAILRPDEAAVRISAPPLRVLA